MSEPPPAEGMFALLDEYPELLPKADITPENARREKQFRETLGVPCIHCGKPSCKTYIATHKRNHQIYWIDLCWKCAPWVREALDRAKERKDDAQ